MADYRPDLKKILKLLLEQGWYIESGRQMHHKCFPPNKAFRMVVISSSPSDHRALQAIKSDLRRSGAILETQR